MEFIYTLATLGPRPPFYKIPNLLWGKDCNYDSDGNSYNPESCEWTELDIALRDHNGYTNDVDRVSIHPFILEPLTLQISSPKAELAGLTAEFLYKNSGGILTKV